MSQRNENYYVVLGVAPTATPEQIRSAYRNAVRLVHPDSAVVASSTTSQEMTQLSQAWSTLSDPVSRRAYDAELFSAQSEVDLDLDLDTDDDFPESDVSVAAPVVRGHFPKSLIGWILVAGIAGVLVLNVLSDPVAPARPDGLLGSGSCVVIDANKLAVEVGCDVDHYGVVRQLIGFDMTCPSDTEAIRDRQGMGQACVVPSE